VAGKELVYGGACIFKKKFIDKSFIINTAIFLEIFEMSILISW